MLPALAAPNNRGGDHALNKRVTHVGKRGVAVETGFRLHLDDAVLQHLLFVPVEGKLIGKRITALNELGRTEPRRNSACIRVVGDQMSDRVNTAMHGRIACTEVGHPGDGLAARSVHGLLHELGDALALCCRYRDDRDAEHIAHFLSIDSAAVGTHLVHHIERQHHRHAQLKELKRQVQVALDIGRIDDVNDAVRLSVEDEVSGNDLLLRVGAQGIDARQIDHGAILYLADLADFLIDCHAGEVAHMLIGAGEGVKKCRFTAVLVADQCKDHKEDHSFVRLMQGAK